MGFLEVLEEIIAKKSRDPGYRETPDDIARLKKASDEDMLAGEKRLLEINERIRKSKLSPIELLREEMGEYQFWQEYFVKPIQHKVQGVAEAGKQEFEKSKISEEEFNQRMFRDDGEMYPNMENGKIQVMAFVPLDLNLRSGIKPEKVLELFHENLTVNEISEKLKRTSKWVRKKLSIFGISVIDNKARFNHNEIPFGWREQYGKLVKDSSEQWLLDKMEEDYRSGVTFAAMARNMNRLRIKPRGLKSWHEETVSKVIEKNKKLKRIFK